MSTTLREQRDALHENLRAQVLQMGSVVGDMVKLAVDSVIENNLDLANKVIEIDDQVDRLERQIIKGTIIAVGMEAPVASDLKFLTATLGIVGEIEKAGDHAVKLARRIKKLYGKFPAELKLSLHQMGEDARRLFSASLRLYAEYDPVLAREIEEQDQEIDNKYSEARKAVLGLLESGDEDKESIVRMMGLFHALEHLADQGVQISKRLRLHYESSED